MQSFKWGNCETKIQVINNTERILILLFKGEKPLDLHRLATKEGRKEYK